MGEEAGEDVCTRRGRRSWVGVGQVKYTVFDRVCVPKDTQNLVYMIVT